MKKLMYTPAIFIFFKKIIDSFQNNPATPFIGGMSVAVKVDGLALWQGSRGFAARNIDAQNNLLPGGTAFTINTSSRIYSITKTFTAALLLELANQRLFKLDKLHLGSGNRRWYGFLKIYRWLVIQTHLYKV